LCAPIATLAARFFVALASFFVAGAKLVGDIVRGAGGEGAEFFGVTIVTGFGDAVALGLVVFKTVLVGDGGGRFGIDDEDSPNKFNSLSVTGAF